MGKLGKSLLALMLGAGAAVLLAGTVVLIAGTMGLLDPATAHAAQRISAGTQSSYTPPVVPWLISTLPDPSGSGRSVIYMHIVGKRAQAPVRDNPTMRVQQSLAPPDLTDGHSGGRAATNPGSARVH
jgi:hypothetical protein